MEEAVEEAIKGQRKTKERQHRNSRHYRRFCCAPLSLWQVLQ